MLTRTQRGDQRISKLARIITQYSTEIQKGEKVLIKGPPIAEALLLALYREVLRCGAYPTIHVDFPERMEIFYQEAAEHQLDYTPVEELFIMKNFDVTLKVLAETNLANLTSIDTDKIARHQVAFQPIRKLEKYGVRWNLTIFPTDAYAQAAGLSLTEFENFFYKACFADEDDPVSKWRELKARQEKWVESLKGAKTIQIKGENTDLTMSVEGNIICNSWGAVNMPCGEIYSSPVEGTLEGEISFEFPAIYLGKEIEDLKLRFKRGRVVDATARKGQDVIDTILNIDEGSSRVGEIGIGTNFNVNRYSKIMLLDEKMGGTIHIALGDAYPETLGTNKSAIHFDILKDLNGNGKIIIDDLVIQEEGIFTEEFLLNQS